MNNLIHADIFFFVTTIAVVLIAALVIVVILYIVRILSDVHYISSVVRKETDHLAEDLEEIRDKVKKEGLLLGFWDFISGLFNSRSRRERSTKKNKIRNK
jgi:xanthine/uracil permease